MHSIDEYPKLYLWLKEKGYNIHPLMDWHTGLKEVQTDITTNGWCADQLFGSVFFYSAPELYPLPIEKFLTETKSNLGEWTKEQALDASQIFKKYAKDFFDLELTTAAELGWFINFTLKWTWVSTYNELYLAGTDRQYKTHVFYNTSYFQSWALNNFSNIASFNIYGKDAKFYKKELKEYCNEVFPDQDFLLHKTKKPSWNATQNTTMFRRRLVVLKHDKGYDIYNLPKTLPYRNLPVIEPSFYTKFYK